MSLQQFSLKNRVALVTGGGKGIGKALALGMADVGADVVVTARTASDLDGVVSEIEKTGRKAMAVPADVTDSKQVDALVQKTMQAFGRIDILVNNAGGTSEIKTMEMTEREWDADMDKNLKHAFLCSQAVGKMMIPRKSGSIINIASIHAIRANPANISYGAAKAGVVNMTQNFACELAAFNIRVNAIIPGYITTRPIFHEWAAREDIIEQVPLKRLAQPGELVGACVYLAADASSYVTGSVIVIDGGLTVKPTVVF
jgi:NAD(P)-dependent dehydrogenase (short-subunit alcohol dehydrogenase family)